MRVLNRTAVTIVGAGPYNDWIRARDAEFAASRPGVSAFAESPADKSAFAEAPADRSARQVPELSVARTKAYGSAYLLPEFTEETDLVEWVEENYSWLFEFQLSAWTEDESAWPKNRDLKMFREWFRIDIHSTVVDAGDEDIEGEDL